MAEKKQPKQEQGANRGLASTDSAKDQQSPYDDRQRGRYEVNEGQPPPPPQRQPAPFRRPPDPCCGCCGSIRNSVIVWDIIFWLYGLLLLFMLCEILLGNYTTVSVLGYVSFCGKGVGGRYSAAATTLMYFVAVSVLTVAIFASPLSPKLRILLTKTFYLLLFPLFFVLAIVVLILNIVEGCYDFSDSSNILWRVIEMVCRLICSLFLVLEGRQIGRANIYCIQVESFYRDNYIDESGNQV